jgi:hypothetical protein
MEDVPAANDVGVLRDGGLLMLLARVDSLAVLAVDGTWYNTSPW